MIRVVHLRVWPLMFGYCDDEKQFNSYVKREKLSLGDRKMVANGAVACFTSWHNEKLGMVTLSPERMRVLPLPDIAGIIAHECEHALQWVYERISEEHAGEEASSYTLQYMVTQCMECYLMSMKNRGWRTPPFCRQV